MSPERSSIVKCAKRRDFVEGPICLLPARISFFSLIQMSDRKFVGKRAPIFAMHLTVRHRIAASTEAVLTRRVELISTERRCAHSAQTWRDAERRQVTD